MSPKKLNLNRSSKVSCSCLPLKLILSICTNIFSKRDNAFFRIRIEVDPTPMEDCNLLAKNQKREKKTSRFLSTFEILWRRRSFPFSTCEETCAVRLLSSINT